MIEFFPNHEALFLVPQSQQIDFAEFLRDKGIEIRIGKRGGTDGSGELWEIIVDQSLSENEGETLINEFINDRGLSQE
jgi:hypothetical protein